MKPFLFLHCLRTNITVTYVSQFMQLISYTFDSSILFSAVLKVFPFEKLKGHIPHLSMGLDDRAARQVALGVTLEEDTVPAVPSLLGRGPHPEVTRQMQRLACDSGLMGSYGRSLGLMTTFTFNININNN